jgi:hypothetical protein
VPEIGEIMSGTLVRQDTDITQWGNFDRAVQTGFDFWKFWDSDPDADTMLGGVQQSPFDIATRTVLKDMPNDASSLESAAVIAQGTRLLSMERFTMAFSDAFNDILFAEELGTTPDLQDIREQNGLSEGDQVSVETLQKFARLITNEGEV